MTNELFTEYIGIVGNLGYVIHPNLRNREYRTLKEEIFNLAIDLVKIKSQMNCDSWKSFSFQSLKFGKVTDRMITQIVIDNPDIFDLKEDGLLLKYIKPSIMKITDFESSESSRTINKLMSQINALEVLIAFLNSKIDENKEFEDFDNEESVKVFQKYFKEFNISYSLEDESIKAIIEGSKNPNTWYNKTYMMIKDDLDNDLIYIN